MTIYTYVNFSLWFSANVILAIFIRVVRLVCSFLFFLEFINLLINIELIPCIVVIFYGVSIPHKINLLFFGFYHLLFRGLFFFLFNFFFKLLLDLLFFSALLLENFFLSLLFKLHLSLPLIKIGCVITKLLCIVLNLSLDFETH